ncbi:hypothetical protein HY640_03465 [Candidatus Woesearchaeota archaeon]|nr:hypothetical protein [Candidatus Woesearchaeota archaeon]
MRWLVVCAAVTVLLFVSIYFFYAGGVTGMQVSASPLVYSVFFCSEQDCVSVIEGLMNSSSTIDCAMYNFNSRLISAAEGKVARFVSDDNYKGSSGILRKDSGGRLMHNKFCVFDNSTVLTGSFNPSSSARDRNNIIIVRSSALARNYAAEFDELWSGVFGGGKKTLRPVVTMSDAVAGSYFCPEDGCASIVEAEVAASKRSVLFMAYSFTHKGIANSLVLVGEQGIDVRGVIDSSSDREVYDVLSAQAIDVRLDKSKGVMHHKVFVIDNETVITGSFNPTRSGDTRNDENLLVIRNRGVATEYVKEFDRLWE